MTDNGAVNDPAIAQLDEERLALHRRFVAGDASALGPLAEPYLDGLYTLCLRMIGNPADAQDCAHEALVLAIRNHSRFTVGRPIRPWLYAIARNCCRSKLRGPWWRRVVAMKPMASPDESAEYLTVGHDRDAKVRRVLMTLPENYREALSLYHLEDMSYREMAEITGAGIPALKQRVRRGSAMLRQKMEMVYPEFSPSRKEGE